jgi:hypothetical protein
VLLGPEPSPQSVEPWSARRSSNSGPMTLGQNEWSLKATASAFTQWPETSYTAIFVLGVDESTEATN